jgi:hypothetical protein
MQHKRPLVAVGLALLLVLAGCTGGGGAGDGATQAALSGDAGGEGDAMGTSAPKAEETAAAADPAASDRKWIYTADARLRVDEFESTRANLSATLAEHGGYVGSSQVSTEERNNETYHDARIVYRVPTENYSAFVEAVRDEGTVLNFEENARDVTGKHADLEARLENLRAERDRLRELYEQANDTEDVLAVQRELSDVQGEIESTEARLEALENQIAYATVTVQFREERPDVTYETENWYDTGVIAAFLESVDGAITAIRALVVGIAYALPYLIAFGVPLAALGLGFKRYVVGGRSIRSDGGTQGEPPSDAEEPDE